VYFRVRLVDNGEPGVAEDVPQHAPGAVHGDVVAGAEGEAVAGVVVDEGVQAFGRLDALVLNAAAIPNGLLVDISEEEFDWAELSAQG